MNEFVSNKTIEKLKHDLVRTNLLTLEDLTKAEDIAREAKQNLAVVLIEEKMIGEEEFLNFIQDNLRIPYVNLEDYSIDEKCLDFVSADDARKYKLIPIFKIENALTVAMADPLDLFALNNIIKCLSCQVEPVICSERLIEEAIDRHYPKEKEDAGIAPDWTEATGEEAIVSSIVSQAIEENVSEIIIEELVVKFRTPEGIKVKGEVPGLLAHLVVSRIKSMAGLDVTVFDLPQLGKYTYEGVSVIVSTFPSTKGERLTIKLYKPPKTIKELNLNIDPQESGLILVAGSEQSAKSFVVYSILNSIDPEKKNIMTLESISKYELKNVTQCEFNEAVGFNLEKALKFIEFQSPDVVYIEEIAPEDLLKIIRPGKLIITETSEENISEEIIKVLSYIIHVKSLDEISVTDLRRG